MAGRMTRCFPPLAALVAAALSCGALRALAETGRDANAPDPNAAPQTGAPATATAPAGKAVGLVPSPSYTDPIVLPRDLTPEQEEKVLKYAREKRPEYYQQILQYHKADPKRYQITVRSLWLWVEKRERMPQRLRDAYDELQTVNYTKLWQLARDIQTTKDPAVRAPLEAELMELTARRFEAEQIIREYRVQEILDQAKRLQEELGRRQKYRDAAIKEMYDQFLQSAARMAPGTQPVKPPASQPAEAHRVPAAPNAPAPKDR